jgi:hypothetical protein
MNTENTPNLEVMLDMLAHPDANLSYFAATRLPFVLGLLEQTQEWEAIKRLVEKLV